MNENQSFAGHIAINSETLKQSLESNEPTVLEAINRLIAAVEIRRSEFERFSHKGEPEFVSASDICTRLSIARATINKWQETRNFPLPVKIGNYCNRWRKAEVDSWVAENF
jgi:predicted DNA-binding transcriptional regulator AlpA